MFSKYVNGAMHNFATLSEYNQFMREHDENWKDVKEPKSKKVVPTSEQLERERLVKEAKAKAEKEAEEAKKAKEEAKLAKAEAKKAEAKAKKEAEEAKKAEEEAKKAEEEAKNTDI